MASTRSRTVLLIEDNPADVEAVRRALNEYDDEVQLRTLSDGLEARTFLTGEGDRGNPADIDLVFLDLNLPSVDGRELLRTGDWALNLHNTPIVVLTTSNVRQDIYRTYRNGANGYIIKPSDWGQFVDHIQSACAFWFSLPSP